MLFALFIERTRVVARFKHCREDVRVHCVLSKIRQLLLFSVVRPESHGVLVLSQTCADETSIINENALGFHRREVQPHLNRL